MTVHIKAHSKVKKTNYWVIFVDYMLMKTYFRVLYSISADRSLKKHYFKCLQKTR